MRRRWTTAVAAACGLLASCSLVTSWDGLTGADAGSHGASGSGGAGGSGGQGGSAIDASDASDASDAADTGEVGDTGADVIDPNACVEKHHYCGGHVVPGSSTKLYICNGDGSASLLESCTHGCLVRTKLIDDHCRCLAGAYYCGGDHIEGDPTTLYKCNVDGSGTLFEHCTKGCIVAPGKDDTCG